jgi:hypothetical protein
MCPFCPAPSPESADGGAVVGEPHRGERRRAEAGGLDDADFRKAPLP